MDLGTTYLGLPLVSPLIVGSGPLDSLVETAQACEKAGAGMLVMHSLFQEQFDAERAADHWSMEHGSGPDGDDSGADGYPLHPDEYFEALAALKKALSIPVVGSINGTSAGNWIMFAREMQEAGADAIELNIYDPVMDGSVSGHAVERRVIETARLVRGAVKVPLAVKLSPYYSSFAGLARDLDNAGVDGIVLFNRFFQPDIDLVNLRAFRAIKLSTPDELPLRLRWAAALSGKIKAGIAVTGGVHSGADALKAVLVGAHAVQVVSCLVQHGAARLATLRGEIQSWLQARNIESLASLRGRLSLENVDNRDAFERANYVDLLIGKEGAAV